MEKKIVVSKRFQKNTFALYDYLLKNYAAKTVYKFLDKLQQRVELIVQHQEIGKLSQKKANIISLTLQPYNRIYYRIRNNAIELVCMFDIRRKSKAY